MRGYFQPETPGARRPGSERGGRCNFPRPAPSANSGLIGKAAVPGGGGILWLLTAPLAWAQSATGPLPPLAPPAPPLPPTFWQQHGTMLIAAGLILIALVAAILWFVLQARPPVAVPPEVLAREALTRLRGHPEDGRALSEISQILRRYLMAVLGLPHQELTTAEFSAFLAGQDKIDAGLAAAATGFLRECDERKFALTSPSVPLNGADRALAIIAEMEKQRARLAVESKVDSHV